MSATITARRLLTEEGPIDYPVILVEDGLISSIEAGPPNRSTDTLTAAFFDVHVHGAVSHDFMAAGPREIRSAGRFLASKGLAHYLPTTVTSPLDTTFRALEQLADAIEMGATDAEGKGCARPVGIHLEGPFVSHIKRGVHPAGCILEPSVELFDRFQEAARGHIRLMTIAPEMPHAVETIAHASAAGVRCSLGHSNATEAETVAGIAAGAASGTHTFNAMRALNHREPGILGALLDCGDLFAEAICDGVHVRPSMIRLWLKMKGLDRAILVTDGMSATGMPEGEYMLGDLAVEVRDGVCLADGTLAGSVLTMDTAVANLQRFTGTSLGDAVRLASGNPARMLGMEELARMTPGAAANFNVFDEAGELTGTMVRGDWVGKEQWNASAWSHA